MFSDHDQYPYKIKYELNKSYQQKSCFLCELLLQWGDEPELQSSNGFKMLSSKSAANKL